MQHLSAIHEKYWSAKCTYFDGIECIPEKYLFWLVGLQAVRVRHGVLELFVLLSTTKSRLVIHRSCCCFVTFTGTDMIINNCVEKDTKSSFCNEFALSNYHTSTRLALEAWKYCRYSTSYY